MAKIPLYQQGNLASPVVGTPGTDTSITNAANSVEGSLRQLGNVAYNSLENDYVLEQRALRQQQTLQRQAEMHMKTLANEGATAANSAGADTAATDMSNELRTKYHDNTDGSRDEFDEKMDGIVNDRLDAETDPERKAMLQIKLAGMRNSQTQSFANWITSRVPDIAKSNANTVGSALRYSVNNSSLSGTQVLQKLDDFEKNPDNLKQYQAAYGNDWQVEMRKHQSKGAQDFLATVANEGAMNGSDKRLKILMADKRFDKYIEGTDKEQFFSRQRAISSARRTEQRIQQEVDNTSTRSVISDVVVKRDTSSMDSLKQTGDQLRQLWNAENAKPPEQRSTETISKLEGEIEQNNREIKNFPKAQRQEEAEKQKVKNAAQLQKYLSQPAIDARNDLAVLNKDIKTNMKTKWTGNKKAAQTALDNYQKKLYKYAQAGLLDKPGSVQNYEKHSEDLGVFIKQTKNTPLTPIDQIIDGVSHLGDSARKFFSGTPPKVGQTSKQTHDAMHDAYTGAMKKNTTRFKELMKRDPTAGDLKKLDAMSKTDAFRAVHGGN